MGEIVQLRKPAVAVWGPIIKVTAVMFVLTQASCFAYGFFFALFAIPSLTSMLQALHVDQVFLVEARLLQMMAAPLVYALLTALSPLVGWWIYSSVDTGAQAKVMWGSAGLHALVAAAFGIGLSGAMAINPLLLLLGLAILTVYTVFFMGLGFIPAQLFKAKL